MSESSVSYAMDQFINKLIAIQPTPPKIRFDEDWPSLCYLNKTSDGSLADWRPTRQLKANDMFTRLSAALEEEVHQDIIEYYSRYWSDPIPAKSADGDLCLLQPWNEEDLERLRGNLIGHALSKRQQKRPLTFFIACPEPDNDYFISVDNYSGEVWLEKPGKPPIRKLENTLAAFINGLSPRPITDME
ncbi:SecY-interacting protein Syd [Neptuniibacter marinus]|uniref:SecY-interacting protein Syd n=1 Tax=Neptuniibacter marinus TaxID=1806670 RepID=UPI0008300E9C|nr:SecY-interacting protein Syd [Neptuniibacter marinus]